VLHGFVGGRVAVVAAYGFGDVVGVVTDGDVRHMSAPRSVLEGAVQLLLSLRGLFASTQRQVSKQAQAVVRSRERGCLIEGVDRSFGKAGDGCAVERVI
jgi:hypothetical protein